GPGRVARDQVAHGVRDEPVADPRHGHRRALREPGRRADRAVLAPEELLDARAERAGEPERGIDRRGVPPGLGRPDELAADTGPEGQIGLRQAGALTRLTESGSLHSGILSTGQDTGAILRP